MLLGLLLVSVFMQLFSTSLGLLANALSERLYSRGRKLALLGALVVGLLMAAQAHGITAAWRPDRLREAVF